MKEIIIILLLLFFHKILIGQTIADKKDSCDTFLYFFKSHEELLKYIENPCPNDSACKEDILKAKADVEAGKIKFLMPLSLGTYEPRQKQQLKRLCDSIGLVFDYELFSCVGQSGQTQGCYGLYMDKILALRFDSNFKESLLVKADTLFTETNPTIYFTECDSLPRLLDNFEVLTDVSITIDKNLLNKLKKCSYGDYPQVDVGFYIDILGNTSGYFVSQFNDCGKSDYKYKKQLSKLAIDYLKTLNKWIPGSILNKKVKTQFNTRVHFE
jgi:hypothetical protein